MQNKGALKFLAIALAVACAYQLSFTFVTRHVENKAARYAAGDAVKEQNYLDSIKSQTVYNLGFIKVQLQAVQGERDHPRSRPARRYERHAGDLDRGCDPGAFERQQGSRFQPGAGAGPRRAEKQYEGLYHAFCLSLRKDFERRSAELYFQYAGTARTDHPNSTNAEVIKVLRSSAEGAIENSFNVLRNRIDKFGVTQPNIHAS